VKEIEQYRDLFINREDAYATQRMDGSAAGMASAKTTRSSGLAWTLIARMDRSSFRG